MSSRQSHGTQMRGWSSSVRRRRRRRRRSRWEQFAAGTAGAVAAAAGGASQYTTGRWRRRHGGAALPRRRCRGTCSSATVHPVMTLTRRQCRHDAAHDRRRTANGGQVRWYNVDWTSGWIVAGAGRGRWHVDVHDVALSSSWTTCTQSTAAATERRQNNVAVDHRTTAVSTVQRLQHCILHHVHHNKV